MNFIDIYYRKGRVLVGHPNLLDLWNNDYIPQKTKVYFRNKLIEKMDNLEIDKEYQEELTKLPYKIYQL